MDKMKTGRAKSLARYLPAIARILMGLPFFVSGLNGFLNFLPQPSVTLPQGATAFAEAMMKTCYMMLRIFGTQLIVGALLLAPTYADGHLAVGRMLVRSGHREQGFMHMRRGWELASDERVVAAD